MGHAYRKVLRGTLDTTNHSAHQRHAAFTPACFALPSGTAPRKRTFQQGRANPNGTATSRTSHRHTVCPDTRSKHAARYHKSSRSPATRCVYRQHVLRTSHQSRANPNGTATSRTYFGHTSRSSSARPFPALLLYYKLATSESSSKTLFPIPHLCYKLATPESISERPSPLLSPAPKSSFPYYFCTTKSPVLIFQLPRYSAYWFEWYYKVASSHLPSRQILRVLKLYYQVTSSHLPAPQILRELKLYYKVASAHLPAPEILRVLKLYYQVASSHLSAPEILRVLQLYYKVASSHLPAPQILRVLKLYYKVTSSHLPAPQILRVLKLYYKVTSSHLPAPKILRVLKLYYKVASSQLPAPQLAPRTKVVLQSRQPAFRTLDTRDLRRGLRVRSPK